MSEDKTYNILFLCTGNSGRSIMAEAIMQRVGLGRFIAYSAGSQPKGHLLPDVKDFLEKMNHPTADLRSKSWDEFADPNAPDLDFVFTLCDQAADETCPIWPGQPMTAHWGFEDPAKLAGSHAEQMAAIADIYRQITNVLSNFVALPIHSLDHLSLQKKLDDMAPGAAVEPA